MATSGTVKINELPLITLENFTANDSFVMLDDGAAKIMTRDVMQAWIQANLRGEKGDTGATGASGRDGRDGRDGTNGANGLSAYQVAVQNGFVGTQQQWLASITGVKGDNGDDGWSPVLALEPYNGKTLLKVVDWQNGQGDKPEYPIYLGSNGYVTDVDQAIDIKGEKGEKGDKGDQGEDGLNGANGETVSSITVEANGSITLEFPSSQTVVSNTPPKLTGWATYKDSQYTQTTPFVIDAQQQVVLPNNKSEAVENLPYNVDDFYNVTSQKLILSDVQGLYSIRLRFKVAPVSSQGFVNISFSKETTDIPFSQDIVLRGDSTVQDVNINTTIYGDSAIVSNGLSLRIKAYSVPVSIYGIEFTIAKLM